tara:strand:- start:468 stop:1109 length:642 start_codon:yes stop_codon:yes gene_type:complete
VRCSSAKLWEEKIMYNVIGSANNRTFRVIWMLEELGQPYQRTHAHPHDASLAPHTPLGKLPVLLVDGQPLTDSAAILTYLADKHGGLTASAGTIARARQDGVTHQILDEIEGPLWTATRHSFILPEQHRVPAIKESLRWEFARSCEKLAVRMQGDFLMGNAFSVPDLLAVHCLDWATSAKFPVENPVLLDYAKRVRARDAYRATRASEKAMAA